MTGNLRRGWPPLLHYNEREHRDYIVIPLATAQDRWLARFEGLRDRPGPADIVARLI